MVVQIVSDDESGDFAGWPDIRRTVPDLAGELLVAKNQEMAVLWTEYGYDIPNSVEGPFCILYEPARVKSFKALVRSDPYGRDRGQLFEPYEVAVVASGLFLVTVVTPDPELDFSQKVIEGISGSLVVD